MKRTSVGELKVAKGVSKKKEDVSKKGVLKPEYGLVSNARAPYWDPHDIHIHVWTRGTIRAEENHLSKYTKKAKPYTGIYCKICHEIKIPFAQDLIDTMPEEPYREKNLKEAMGRINRSMANWKKLARVITKCPVSGSPVSGSPVSGSPVGEELFLVELSVGYLGLGNSVGL